MSFPNDIKLAMKECILKILWSKDDIVSFFKDNNCTSKDIKILGNYKEMFRHTIVDTMFDHLTNKPDEGIGQFRAILQSLVNWDYFDNYYFLKLKKLNKNDAINSITHLKQLQEIRDNKIIETRKERERKEKLKQSVRINLSDLKTKFLSLLQGKIIGAKRGYVLQELLLDICRASSLITTEPFLVNGEQIDGAFKYDGEHYIIEAKWQDKLASNEPVYQFVGKIEGKMYGRGIFVSIHGFSKNVVQSIVTGKAIKTIFIDGSDLVNVLEGMIDFNQLLEIKIKAAQTKGLIYIDAISGRSKI